MVKQLLIALALATGFTFPASAVTEDIPVKGCIVPADGNLSSLIEGFTQVSLPITKDTIDVGALPAGSHVNVRVPVSLGNILPNLACPELLGQIQVDVKFEMAITDGPLNFHGSYDSFAVVGDRLQYIQDGQPLEIGFQLTAFDASALSNIDQNLTITLTGINITNLPALTGYGQIIDLR